MRRIRKVQLISTGEAPRERLVEAVLDRLGAELPQMADSERASRALKEAQERTAYRSDTFAHLLGKCRCDLATLLDSDRTSLHDRERNRFVDSMRGVIALANVAVRNCLIYGEELTPLNRQGVAYQVGNVPDAPQDLVARILEVVDVNLMQEVCDAARRIPEDNQNLPWNRVSEALVPFTDEYKPQPLHANQCWCGYWLEVGVWQVNVWQCPFCGEPSPPPVPQLRSTLLWRQETRFVLQLSAVPPATMNSLSQQRVHSRWRALRGETVSDDEFAQIAMDDDQEREDEDLARIAPDDEPEGEYDE